MNESLTTLHDYIDIIRLQDRLLVSGGLSESVVGEKAVMFRSCAAKLIAQDTDPQAESHGFFVPGRIELLGKHTDYAGGRSILAAAEKGFCFVAAVRDDDVLDITDAGSGERISFSIDSELSPQLGHWSNYPQTAARRASRNFSGPLRGGDIAFISDLPPAAGMSSSSAMMVGFFLVLSKINQLDQQEAYRENIQSKEDLAGYLGTVENGQSFKGLSGDKGVGTFGGSEDHTAILCCQSEQFSQYSYCPVVFERTMAFPSGYILAIASSGVAAEKTGAARAKYNRASRLASKVAEIWRKQTDREDAHMAAMLETSANEVGTIKRILQSYDGEDFTGRELLSRFEQFYGEHVEIVPSAGDALENQDLSSFVLAADRSQFLTETLLGNQVPETIFLAHSARESGALAATAFGAGFGGSVWALIEQKNSELFLNEWEQCYTKKFSQHNERAEFFITRAGPAAFSI